MDALSLVAHTDGHFRAGQPSLHVDRRIRRRIFLRIGEQIDENAFQAHVIRHDARQLAGDIEANALPVQHTGIAREERRQVGVEHDRLELQR